MLEIKKITKIYETEGFKQKALDNISVNFRECEFAAILGPSGSGKTTFLNIIGGLDHYTSGDLKINEVSTKNYTDRDWDTYRNHRVGFVFQSYNLISHQSVVQNVELALTLSGVSKEERRKRALEALKKVGLQKHVNKRPNQLSGGQMQRVAIARALVNDPEIILADEPTGALDSETSKQIMDVLKEISKTKLVIMVTHNPELAEEYATRIINVKDGHIISDSNPYDGKVDTSESLQIKTKKSKKTKMSFFTALGLSFNNLMTKKGRTVLVAFAGSIGIIGIALILSVSTGFQRYVDSIQEETLTSYPLTIMKESFDLTTFLLGGNYDNNEETKDGEVIENKQISDSLASIKSNDIKSFKKYIEDNESKLHDDILSIGYRYSVDPLIYTKDTTNKVSKVNPNDVFNTMYSSTATTSMGAMGSVFQPIMNSDTVINEQYDLLKGRMPNSYDELLIVLPNKNTIPDLLTYSLGFRDSKELTDMVTKIFRGETIEVDDSKLKLTYDDLLNAELKLILPTSLYKYNSKYDVYEDMTENEDFMNNLYKNALNLKIVGIVTAKEGITAGSLNVGISYRQDLVDYIINESSKTDIVKKQLEKKDIDVFSGNRFDDKKNTSDFSFSDLVSVDEEKLKNVFKIDFKESDIEAQSQKYINNINDAITTDTTEALTDYNNAFDQVLNGFIDYLDTDTYLNTSSIINLEKELEKKYYIPASSYNTIYKGILDGIVEAYDASIQTVPEEFRESMKESVYNEIINTIKNQSEVILTSTTMAKTMTETRMKVDILSNVSEMTANITKQFASSISIDQNAFASAFKLNFSTDELMRVVSAMNTEEATADTNLIKLGYQDKDEPSMIEIYFSSFDGKEDFIKFIDDYNNTLDEEKKINYSDITGVLMSSVKSIVDAVSYVLIAFVSISLIVSSIMIGVITYISVFERTKEIGILRSIGASKGNISSIFNAETFIIGFLSGLFGIGITYGLLPIINKVLYHFTKISTLYASLKIKNAIYLVILSIILTLIGGLIPAKTASKKDPVEALRSE